VDPPFLSWRPTLGNGFLLSLVLVIEELLFLHGDPPLIALFYFKAFGILLPLLHEDPPVSLEKRKVIVRLL
jgi:hypothetical protein